MKWDISDESAQKLQHEAYMCIELLREKHGVEWTESFLKGMIAFLRLPSAIQIVTELSKKAAEAAGEAK